MATSQQVPIVPINYPPTQIPPPTNTDAKFLVDFLNPRVANRLNVGNVSLRLAQIQSLSYDELMQFPICVEYMFPVAGFEPFDQQALVYARSCNPILQDMRISAQHLMFFFGFDVYSTIEGEMIISYNTDQPRNFARWLKNTDPSHTWINRMLESLRIFGLHHEASRIYTSILDVTRKLGCPVSPITLMNWGATMNDPLYVLSKGYLNYQDQFNVYQNFPVGCNTTSATIPAQR